MPGDKDANWVSKTDAEFEINSESNSIIFDEDESGTKEFTDGTEIVFSGIEEINF